MAEALLACERSYERLARVYESLTRDHECLRVLGGLSEAGIAGFLGFSGWRRPAGMQALVRALDERLQVFTRDHECLLCWAGCLKQDFQDGGGPADM